MIDFWRRAFWLRAGQSANTDLCPGVLVQHIDAQIFLAKGALLKLCVTLQCFAREIGDLGEAVLQQLHLHLLQRRIGLECGVAKKRGDEQDFLGFEKEIMTRLELHFGEGFTLGQPHQIELWIAGGTAEKVHVPHKAVWMVSPPYQSKSR